MIARVLISRSLLASFRRAALSAYPNEFMQTLWGTVRGDTVTVEALRDVAHTATPETVGAEIHDQFAAKEKLQYLGTLHDHPEPTDATPSQADWDDAFNTGEIVFGVMAVWKGENEKFRTAVEFWETRPRIAVVHPRVRAPRKKKPIITDAIESNVQNPAQTEVTA